MQNNLIGTDATGAKALSNGRDGVTVHSGAHNNLIAGNVLSGNGRSGVWMEDDGTFGNVVQANRIGTDATGARAVPNPSGVEVFAANNVIDSNIISGNPGEGVVIEGSGSSIIVAHNIIGASATMTTLANGVGVHLSAGPNTVAGNVIWFNLEAGVFLSDSLASGNVIQSNSIAFNSGDGVSVHSFAHGNTIGGTSAGQGNAILANRAAGVLVDGTGSVDNAIERNAIFANAAGIVLSNGGNNNQASPVLLSAIDNGTGTTSVSGTLHAAANETFRLEFFDNPSGGAQGLDFRDFLNVTTDGNGDATFAMDLAGDALALTATATDSNGNTSAFSALIRVARS